MLLNVRRVAVATLATAALTAALNACSPALDWRELRPEGARAQALFPCKPDRHVRSVPLAGEARRMEMLSCSADGVSWALAFVDVAEPAQAGAVLDALAEAARQNVGAPPPRRLPLAVPGMTPADSAQRLVLEGRTPDGKALQAQVGLFVRGVRVYQAMALGPRVGADAADTFFAGLQLPP